MRVLYIAEIVGKTGVFAVKSALPRLKAEFKPDFTIACADSATGGAGLGVQHAVYLRKLGVECVTLGEGAFFKKDLVEYYPRAPWVLRPANYPAGVPGRGFRVFPTPAGRLGVIVLLGQTGFTRVHPDNPFAALDQTAGRLGAEADALVLDFHAATTAEKRTMAFHAEGKVAAMFGSHGRVRTADASVSAAGTATITDCGRTGSQISVGGQDPETRVCEYISGIPEWAADGTLGVQLQGCVLDIGADGGASGLVSFAVDVQGESR